MAEARDKDRMSLNGRSVLVLGLGETGVSIARFVRRRGAARVRVADTREVPPGLEVLRAEMPEVQFIAGAFDTALLVGIDLVAASPGVPIAQPVIADALARGLPVIGDIELFARALPHDERPKIVAITGTNGKTTVTALAGALLAACGVDVEVAGNIGPAALEAWLRREDEGRMPEAWVLELSSFQLETTSTLACDAATVLNITEDHFDRYTSLDAYAAAKARIFAGVGVQVLNRDDEWSRGMALPGRRIITFGLDAPRERDHFGLLRVRDALWLARGETPLVALDELHLAGLHNAANALAALALLSALEGERLPGGVDSRAIEVHETTRRRDKAQGAANERSTSCAVIPGEPLRAGGAALLHAASIHDETMLRALREFRGLPHRVQRVAELDGVVWYDDSKGTNVGATLAALDGLGTALVEGGNKLVLVAGGEGKGQDFAPLAAAAARSVRAVVLIGRDAPVIRAALARAGVPLHDAASMEDAVRIARSLARRGDAVLLSPACASFDMFRNYKHRGEAFVAAMQALTDARAT